MQRLGMLTLILFSLLPQAVHSCEFSPALQPDCAEELEEPLTPPLHLQRSANLLHLPTAKGALAYPVFNRRYSDDYTNPFVVNYFQELSLVVVWVFEKQKRTVYLVNMKTGEQTQVDGFPLISPDKKRLLVYSQATTEKNNAKLIAIYQLKRDKLYPEMVLSGDDNRLQPWNPAEVKWQSATEISFVRLYDSAGQQVQQQHLLQLTEQQWRLVQ